MKTRRRLISIALTFAMCLALAAPAFAEEPPISKEEALGKISFSYDIGTGSFETTNVDESIKLGFEDPMDGLTEFSVPGYVAIRRGTVFTVTNTATVDDGSYISIYMTPYVDNGAGAYVYDDFHQYYLTKKDGFYPDYASPDEGGGLVELHAGESCQFTLPANWAPNGEQMVFYVKATLFYPEYEYAYWKYAYCLTDDAAVDKALAGTSAGETPTAPSTPAADAYQAAIPELSGKVEFSNDSCGTYQTQKVTDVSTDENGELDIKRETVTVYEFPVGTQVRLTDDAVKNGYDTISDVTEIAFWEKEMTITEASTRERTYFVNSANDPSGFTFYIRGVNPDSSFSDVASGAYYEEPVKWAVRYGITSGTSATTFSPDATCTTAQIITFIWHAKGSPDPVVSNPFTDIKPSDYYYTAAVWASENHLISGNQFNGNAPCTRGETMRYLWTLVGQPDAGKSSFTDVGAYSEAVAWAVQQGITAGTSATTFSPDATCTRAQIMTFLYHNFA